MGRDPVEGEPAGEDVGVLDMAGEGGRALRRPALPRRLRPQPPLPVAPVEPGGEERLAMGPDLVEGVLAGEDVGVFDMAGE